jgi:hypothetical protein
LARSSVRIISPYKHDVKGIAQIIAGSPYLQGVLFTAMDDELIRKVRAEFARQGGKARARALTAEQRRKSAIKASKAAAKARTRKAKEGKHVRESEE